MSRLKTGARGGEFTPQEYREAWADVKAELDEMDSRAQADSLDQICAQIRKVIRTERDDGDWYAALLQDGSWLHFHEMNDILRRFIFDVRSYVDFTGQTVYERR